jgi:hypothetical protein
MFRLASGLTTTMPLAVLALLPQRAAAVPLHELPGLLEVSSCFADAHGAECTGATRD